MLLTISYQVVDNLVQWQADEDPIELSESMDDGQEENDLSDQLLFFPDWNPSKKLFTIPQQPVYPNDLSALLIVALEIPIPPPELA